MNWMKIGVLAFILIGGAGLALVALHSRPSKAAPLPAFLPAGASPASVDLLERADAYKMYMDKLSYDCRKGLATTIDEMTICTQVELREIQSAIPPSMQYDPTYRALTPLPKPEPETKPSGK